MPVGFLRALTPRGYTGHEHIDHAGIIHMNGRIYDIKLGRFLQADPSGYFFKSIGSFFSKYWRPLLAVGVAAVTSGIASGAIWSSLGVAGTSSAWGVAIAGGALSGYVSTGTARGALFGAFSAAAFHGIGKYFDGIAKAAEEAPETLGRIGSFVSNNTRLTKVITHATAGGVLSKLQGARFGSSFLAAGVTQAFSGAIDGIKINSKAGTDVLRVAAAAVLGGTTSEISGGKFANGAVTGAFSRAFNDGLEESDHNLDARRRGLQAELDKLKKSGVVPSNRCPVRASSTRPQS